MYKIGEFSRLCKVSVKTLHYYDSEGLLCPDYIDKFTSYRYYSASKLAVLNQILALKELGFSLDEIRKQLSAENHTAIIDLIQTKQRELSVIKIQTESQLKRLTTIKEFILRENKVMTNVIIKNADDINIASARKLFSNRNEVISYKNQMSQELVARKVPISTRYIIINYEIEHAEVDLDYEIGIELLGELPDGFTYKEKQIKISCPCASVVCNVNELDDAYKNLQTYLQDSAYQIIGAFYELYYDEVTVELKVPVCKLTERTDIPKNDDVSVPFVNAEFVIGKWCLIDCLPSRDHFNPDKIKYTGEKQIKELYFLPGGEQYWCFGWTKGYLLSSFGYPHMQGKNAYTIEQIGGQNFMFIEMKLNEYYFQNGKPEIWVLKQIDDLPHKKQEIRIIDKTDYPFENDEAVLGEWKVCDIVKDLNMFNPDIANPSFPEHTLFFRSINFRDNGNCTITYAHGDKTVYTEPDYTWTKGLVLAHISKVAEQYILRRLKGCDYLFIEWKSGDYTFGGRKPCYYVFRRTE